MRQKVVTSAAAIAAALLAGATVAATSLQAQSSVVAERGTAPLIDALNSLGNTSRVLVIGAHPDDEDTQLIAWLARGRHVETAYLSLTRGDGGQNLIGNELGEALGVIRTQELLAARKIDGGRQFFTRAFDFGFSKNADETLQHWPKDTIMGDVVRVVRAFRPQVIVAVFSGTPRDGHGHHQVSGILARDAYDASGDTTRFPVAIYGLPWTASKFYRRVRTMDDSPTDRINVGEYDAVTGRSYAEIAADSRSQHKSQGFGVLQQKGAIIDVIGLEGSRVTDIKNAAAETGLFAGIDTTWARLRALTARADVKANIDAANAAFAEARRLFHDNDPTPSVAPLARAVTALRAARDSAGARPPRLLAGDDDAFTKSRLIDANGFNLTNPSLNNRGVTRAGIMADAELWNALDVNEQRAERALLLASGVAIEALAPNLTIPVAVVAKFKVPDTMAVNIAVFNRGKLPIQFTGATARQKTDSMQAVTVAPDSAARVVRSARTNKVTSQWWRVTPRDGAWFTATVDSRDDAQRAEATGVLAHIGLVVAGVPMDLSVPVVDRIADPVKGELLIRTAGVPGITVGLDHSLEYIRANVPITRQFRVHVLSAYTAPESVTVTLQLPKGLTADSITRARVLTPDAPGQTIVFFLKGTVEAGLLKIGATVMHQGVASQTGYYVVNYDHITPQRMYSPSGMWLSSVAVVRPPRAHIAYVPGVGDSGYEALAQLDINVDRIDPAAVATTDFTKYSAVVLGPRAYASNEVLVANNPRLLDYTKKGGTLIVQYGQTEMMKPGIMPFPIQLARTAERVTDETAPITVLQPNSKILTSPNKIGASDWDGWVQERATYMPTTFDKNYSTLLQMNDPGEPANKSGLLVAQYGKGTYVYVTLALFRQLPAGVPGAARILMNLISATTATATPHLQ